MRSTARKVNAGFAVGLAIIAIIGIASIVAIQQFAETSHGLNRSYVALTEIEGVVSSLTEAESAQRAFIITGDDSYIRQFENAQRRARQHVDRLNGTPHPDTAQGRLLTDIAQLADERVQLIETLIAVRREQGAAAAAALVAEGTGRQIMAEITSLTTQFEVRERQRRDAAASRASRTALVVVAIIIGGSVFAFLALLLSAFLIRRDQAERRRAEQALRESETLLSQFMENLPIGVMVIDPAGQPRFANNAAVEILGPGVLIDTGTQPLPLFRASDRLPYPALESPLTRALAGQTTTVDDAEVISENRHVPVQLSAAPIYDAHGRIAYAIAAFSDVTERSRTEEALRSAKEAAESASRTKSDFLARMSHELRTPLNSVIGFANILLKNKAGNLRDQDTAYLNRIQENGKHLLLLINDILDLSKIEAGKIELEREPLALAPLIDTLMHQWDEQMRNGDVAMQYIVPAGLSPLHTDGARLRQVLINLIGNAVKFTEQGQITVSVDATPGTTRPSRIRVSDTGIGIPDERIDAIFDAFEQAESSTTRKYGGTGLGLPISRALCELLGYRLSVRSRLGEGTEFTIDLQPETSPQPEAAPMLVDVQPLRRHSNERLVLIVDDEADSRILLTHYIEEFGCRAIATHSSLSAVRLARELKPDLITLDLMMPDMNGWDTLTALKQDPELAEIPVVIVSLVAKESRASVLGEIDLLQKPVDRGALFDVLRRNLGSRNARILIVDDAEDARRLLCDMLAGHAAELRSAEHGQDALMVLRDFEADLIITDLLMPVMDGMTFLEILRSTPRFQHVPIIVVSSKDITAEERERLSRHTAAVLQKGNALESELRRTLAAVLNGDLAERGA